MASDERGGISQLCMFYEAPRIDYAHKPWGTARACLYEQHQLRLLRPRVYAGTLRHVVTKLHYVAPDGSAWSAALARLPAKQTHPV